MKVTPNTRGKMQYYGDDEEKWFDPIQRKKFIEQFKNPKSSKGRSQKITGYVTKATEVKMQEIVEKNQAFFTIRRDLINSIIDTAIQLYDDIFIKKNGNFLESNRYLMRQKLYEHQEGAEEIAELEYAIDGFIESHMERKANDSKVSFDSIIASLKIQVEGLIPYATDAGKEWLRQYIENDLNDRHKLTKVWERVRKRRYRKGKIDDEDRKIYAVK